MADQEVAVAGTTEKTTKSTSGIKNFLAGGIGGVCCVASGHPLDTIKVLFCMNSKFIIFFGSADFVSRFINIAKKRTLRDQKKDIWNLRKILGMVLVLSCICLQAFNLRVRTSSCQRPLDSNITDINLY